MLGRLRASSCSLDSLELERAPPKILKDDSLSIYEATIVKLRLGSQRVLSSSAESMKIDAEYTPAILTESSQCDLGRLNEAMEIETSCTVKSVSKSSQLTIGSFYSKKINLEGNCSPASLSPCFGETQSGDYSYREDGNVLNSI